MQVSAPRLLWHDPAEWLRLVLCMLDAHPELVSRVRFVHGLDDDAPEITRDQAEAIGFTKHEIQPRLSDLQKDINAIYRVTRLIALKAGLTDADIEGACITPVSISDDDLDA